MRNENYKISQYSVSQILADVEADRIAVPELQRPFVWKDVQVRDLMDSLYRGYPIGYFIVWQNAAVKVRWGRQAFGKKILIDGQQRITALMAAVLGREVLDEKYHTRNIQIAFHPFKEEQEHKFAVWEDRLREDKRWIPDISVLFQKGFSYRRFEQEYIKENPGIDTRKLDEKITQLKNIISKDVGVIELSFLLDIDVVTEIFIRINTQGKPLNQEDFAMSKISVFENNEGDSLRKTIDYFCHLCYDPSFLNVLKEGEGEFLDSECGKNLLWMGEKKQEFYIPSYGDLLKTVCLSTFGRGRIADLVQILSGKTGKSTAADMEQAKEGFRQLKEGVFAYVKEENFWSFLEVIWETGFITAKMIPSQTILHYMYALYLRVCKISDMSLRERKSFLSRWFVMSILTARYQTASESTILKDLSLIEQKGARQVLDEIEETKLKDNFFSTTLKQKLRVTGTRNHLYSIYIASLIQTKTPALYSKDIFVRDLIVEKTEKTLFFSKASLQKQQAKADATELANMVWMDKEVKSVLKRKSPREYGKILLDRCEKQLPIGKEVLTREELLLSLKQNCIPASVFEMETMNYELFLEARRKMMAEKIKNYYRSL